MDADAIWDGLYGPITNIQHLTPCEILAQYRQQWRIKEFFRIHKHHLELRPIYHAKESRIRAHVLICFLAYSLMRHLERRLRIQLTQPMGMTEVREALGLVDFSILRHEPTGKRFRLPGAISDPAEAIYRAMGLKWNRKVSSV